MNGHLPPLAQEGEPLPPPKDPGISTYRPARTPYAPAQPDSGHVMDSLAALHLKVDALTRIVSQLLRSLADDPDPEAEDVRDLEGGPAGQERDQSMSLDVVMPEPPPDRILKF
jgi:hypothetical protein